MIKNTNIVYPHTIENCIGEKLIFLRVQEEPDGDILIVENFVAPGIGPVTHTHFLQDEGLTVIKGKLGYQILGEAMQYANPGDQVVFKRGTPHRFWNAGQETLNCIGWVQPANSVVFFLSALFAAQNKSGSAKPETFDAAYLMTRYASEYDIPEIPKFVKKVVIPITYFIGRLVGKYSHFKDAPEPLRREH